MRSSNFQDNEIAEKMGVAPSAISNWRQGLNMAKGKNLRRLAELLHCRPAWLLGAEESEEPSLGGAPVPHGKDVWQQRALAAEKKLAALRTGLRVLLETSADLRQSSPKLTEGPASTSGGAKTIKGDEGSLGTRAQE